MRYNFKRIEPKWQERWEEAPKSIFPNVISKDQTIIGDENLPDLVSQMNL